jgi:hypothetical protein
MDWMVANVFLFNVLVILVAVVGVAAVEILLRLLG